MTSRCPAPWDNAGVLVADEGHDSHLEAVGQLVVALQLLVGLRMERVLDSVETLEEVFFTCCMKQAFSMPGLRIGFFTECPVLALEHQLRLWSIHTL